MLYVYEKSGFNKIFIITLLHLIASLWTKCD